MLGLLLVVLAALNLRRIWPDAIVFLAIYATVATPIGMLLKMSSRAALGERVDWSPAAIAGNFLRTLVIATIVYLIVFGLKKMVRRLRRPGEPTS